MQRGHPFFTGKQKAVDTEHPRQASDFEWLRGGEGVTRIGRTLAVPALAVLALTSCSGGDDKRVAPATSGPTTTGRPVDTSFTGQNSAEFCMLARTYNERFTKVGANATPVQLRAVAREGQSAITQAVSAAPPEIKTDVQVLASAFSTLLAELEKVDFDVAKLPPAALSSLSTAEFQASTTRFQAYNRTVCGLS